MIMLFSVVARAASLTLQTSVLQGGADSNTCMMHSEIAGGIYGNPAWGVTDSHDGYQGWVMCCQ